MEPQQPSTDSTSRPDSRPPAIEVRDLWLSFGGWNVLEAIDLTVKQGEFLGLIGPNGAGKTVLLRVLLGLIKPDRGSVRVLGKSPRTARGNVAYVPQHAAFDRLFPIHVLDVALMGRLGRSRLLRPYTADDRQKARQALDTVGIADLEHRQIGELSGGQLQRVLIARALAVNSRVLLLDEPTANLDSTVAGHLYELLGELAGELTIVLVDHDIGVMSRHVQSVGCLNRRLHHHHGAHPSQEMLEQAYGYPVDVVVHDHDHGHAHRILDSHDTDEP